MTKPSFNELQLSWEKATQYKRQVDLATRMVHDVKKAVDRAALGQIACAITLAKAQQEADIAMNKVKTSMHRYTMPQLGDSYFAKVTQNTDYSLSIAFSLDVMTLGTGKAKLTIVTDEELRK